MRQAAPRRPLHARSEFGEPFGVVELTGHVKPGRIHMPPYDRHPRPHAALAAAYAQPVLRQLMPVNSHFNLWFSPSR